MEIGFFNPGLWLAVTTGFTNRDAWFGYQHILYPTERERIAFGNPPHF